MENTLEQKLQEYRTYEHKCDEAYAIYDKLDDKHSELYKELRNLAVQKYLSVEKLKSLLPWLPEVDTIAWENYQGMHCKLSAFDSRTTIRFAVDMTLEIPLTGPELHIEVIGNDEVKINLMDEEDVVNDAIAYYMQIINETRDAFLNEVKSVFNL